MVTDGGPVVCIVDDDSGMRRSLSNLLTSVGFRVETFQSAEAFLESDRRKTFGCMVLDLRLTGMSGLDLIRHLTATGGGIPVIILTGHGDDDARLRCIESGAVEFFKKPVESGILLDAVRTIMASLTDYY